MLTRRHGPAPAPPGAGEEEPKRQIRLTITALTAPIQPLGTNLGTTRALSKISRRTHRKNMSQAKVFPSSWIKSEEENDGSWHAAFLHQNGVSLLTKTLFFLILTHESTGQG